MGFSSHRAFVNVLFLLIALDNASAAPAKFIYRGADKNKFFSVEETPGYQIFRFSGILNSNSNKTLINEALHHLLSNKEIFVSMDSKGGTIEDFQAVVRALRWKLQGHALYTFVEEGKECSSACLALFLAGDYRFASERSRFGFHAVTNSFSAQLSLRESRNYIRSYGAGPKLLAVLDEKRALETLDATYLTATEMHASQAVDRVVPTGVAEFQVSPQDVFHARCLHAMDLAILEHFEPRNLSPKHMSSR